MKEIVYWLKQIFEAIKAQTAAEAEGAQANWNESDSTKLSYIQNKPDVPVRITVSGITTLTKEQLDALKVGDQVIKVTGNQKHLYVVTYKGEGSGEGICLTYAAAGYGETVSYDRTENGWEYNSTDIKTYGDE